MEMVALTHSRSKLRKRNGQKWVRLYNSSPFAMLRMRAVTSTCTSTVHTILLLWVPCLLMNIIQSCNVVITIMTVFIVRLHSELGFSSSVSGGGGGGGVPVLKVSDPNPKKWVGG